MCYYGMKINELRFGQIFEDSEAVFDIFLSMKSNPCR